MLTDPTRLRDFPALDGVSYLNTAAESIPPVCVHEAIEAYWRDKVKGMKGRDGHGVREAYSTISCSLAAVSPK
jgi:hypothetical protein